MKKRFLHIILTAAAVFCCTLSAAVSVSAARPLEDTIPNCKLYDEDNFLSAEEQSQINQMISEVSRDIDMYVAVGILNGSGQEHSRPSADEYSDEGADVLMLDSDLTDDEVERYADDLYDELFNIPYGKETDGVLLMLNMPTHYIYISTCGLGELYYYNGSADNRISAMVDNLISYMRNSDYTGAVNQFCEDLRDYQNKGFPENAYTYNYGTGQYAYAYKGELFFAEKLPWWFGYDVKKWGLIGLVVGGLTALISMLIVKSNYKFKKSLNPTNYVSQKDTRYLVKDDVFIRTHTTKHRIDTDRGGGGGGGGGGFSHTSSGGFSHGGGGGHW